MDNITVETIKKRKNQTRISMITAYDALFATLFDGRVDIILVGDSLNTSFGGQKDTLSITFEEMLYHAKAVCRKTKHALIVFDMPFGSYPDETQTLQHAIRVYRETSAHAVKIEGGQNKAPIIHHLTQNGIAVMGHIGLLPQFVRAEGGYKIKGKTEENIEQLLRDAKAVEEAGAFCIVLEGVKSEAAKIVSESVSIPIIGIGAGPDVDGQVLVFSDMLGIYEEHTPKFVRKYMQGAQLIKEAVEQFDADIKSGNFPSKDESY